MIPVTTPVHTAVEAKVLAGPRRFVSERVRMREPSGTEIRVRIEGCGVCGSNLEPWKGRDWFSYPFEPGAPGHEGWGTVDAVGSEVTSLSVGQRVAFLSSHAFAAYDYCDADEAVVLPSVLDGKPFPGEPLACVMNIWSRAQVRADHTVAIVGAGFLGCMLTQLASCAGARVIAISRRESALEFAAKFGAAETIVMDDHERIIRKVQELTDNAGCEVVIEAVGAQWPLDLAGELTGIRGRLVIAGYHQDSPRRVNMQLWNWRGLDVINAHERDPRVYRRGIERAIDAVRDGMLDPFPCFTHVLPMREISRAFELLENRPSDFLKALVIND